VKPEQMDHITVINVNNHTAVQTRSHSKSTSYLPNSYKQYYCSSDNICHHLNFALTIFMLLFLIFFQTFTVLLVNRWNQDRWRFYILFRFQQMDHVLIVGLNPTDEVDPLWILTATKLSSSANSVFINCRTKVGILPHFFFLVQ